jgi:hypothetical protein
MCDIIVEGAKPSPTWGPHDHIMLTHPREKGKCFAAITDADAKESVCQQEAQKISKEPQPLIHAMSCHAE